MKVKFFWSTHSVQLWSRKSRDPVAALEEAVNAWLAAHPQVRIVSVQQSVGGGGQLPVYMASVWYEPDPEPHAQQAAGG